MPPSWQRRSSSSERRACVLFNLVPSSSSSTSASFDEIQCLIIGLARDLRGLCSSLVSKHAYSSFFDWLYPAYLPLFVKALFIFYDRLEVYNPLLKFFHELTYNRQERLVFESTKASAYFLFRETSNVLYLFQTKTILHIDTTVSETDGGLFYKAKLKPIITCLRIIQACLSGRRVSHPTARPSILSSRELCQFWRLPTLRRSMF